MLRQTVLASKRLCRRERLPGGLALQRVAAVAALVSILACSAATHHARDRPTSTAGANVSAAVACDRCHDAAPTDDLTAAHARVGVGCEDCHNVPDDHARRATPGSVPTWESSLSDTALASVDSGCRTCHTRSEGEDSLGRRFLHWRNIRKSGLYSRSFMKRCVNCHQHGPHPTLD
jgi:hypothetical protein